MNKQGQQWRRLTEKELWRFSDRRIAGAEQAEKRVREVKEAGQKVAVYYSELDGFQLGSEDGMIPPDGLLK